MDRNLLTLNPEDILNDADIDVVIEVMGGIEETRNHLKKALDNGKHVVTANKDLMAVYGPELLLLLLKTGAISFMRQVLPAAFPS